MAAYLHKKQIDTAKPLQDAADVATTYYDYKGDCPAGEQLSKRTLVIPNYHTLKKTEIARIAQSLNHAWAELASGGSSVQSAVRASSLHETFPA